MGVERLPGNMAEALSNLEKNKTILKALGPDLSTSYLAVKNAEYESLKNLSLEKELELLLEKY